MTEVAEATITKPPITTDIGICIPLAAASLRLALLKYISKRHGGGVVGGACGVGSLWGGVGSGGACGEPVGWLRIFLVCYPTIIFM